MPSVALQTAFATGLVLLSVSATADEIAECADAAEAGQRLRDAQTLLEAREQFRRCGRASCPTIVRDDCVRFLEELGPSMPSIVLHVKSSAGADLSDVAVSRDGKPLVARSEGAAVELNPGASTFRFEAAGFQPKAVELVIAEAEQRRVIEVTLEPVEGPHEVATLPEPGETAGPGPAPWVVGGLGLASLIGFGVLEGVAWGEYGDVEERCGTAGTCTDDDLGPLRGKYIGAVVLLGVGVAALATATVLYVVLDEGPAVDGEARPAGDVALEVTLGLGKTGAGLRGRF